MENRVSTSRDVNASLSPSAVFASDIGRDSLPMSCLMSYCLHEIDITPTSYDDFINFVTSSLLQSANLNSSALPTFLRQIFEFYRCCFYGSVQINIRYNTTNSNQQRTKTLWVTYIFDFSATCLGLHGHPQAHHLRYWFEVLNFDMYTGEKIWPIYLLQGVTIYNVKCLKCLDRSQCVMCWNCKAEWAQMYNCGYFRNSWITSPVRVSYVNSIWY
jgi:hypothetical protein